MGCTESKQSCLPEWESAANAHAWLQQYPSTDNPTPWALPAIDKDVKHPAAASNADQQISQQMTTIQVI
jgi:hypothetical protein